MPSTNPQQIEPTEFEPSHYALTGARVNGCLHLYWCVQVIKMLVIVVALFAFCWLPLQTYNLLSEIYPQINT